MKKIILLFLIIVGASKLFAQTSPTSMSATAITVNCATWPCTGTGFTYYDPAGTANYANSANVTQTFCPSAAGQGVSINFSAFALENGWDFLAVYDGNSTTAPLISSNTGTQLAGVTIQPSPTNASGCITIRFTSDASGVAAGWTATAKCLTPCLPLTAASTTPTTPQIVCPSTAIAPGSALTFNGTGSAATAPNVIDQYVWKWGDGTAATYTTSPTTTHAYTTPGYYQASLTVNDNNLCAVPAVAPSNGGCSSTNAVQRPVIVPPTPIFTGTSTNVAIACGATATLTGVGQSQTVAEQIPDPTVPVTFLPDGNGSSYNSTADFTGLFPAGAVMAAGCFPTVNMNLEHTFLGDLQITLIAPNGQSVIIHNRTGSGNNLGTCAPDNTSAGCGAAYQIVSSGATATLGAATTITTPVATCNSQTCSTGGYVPAGTYNSANAFTSLNGAPLNGTWTIRFTDLAASDDGYLFDWGLTFPAACYKVLASATPDITAGAWASTTAGAPAVPAGAGTSAPVAGNISMPQPCPAGQTCAGNTWTNTVVLGPFNTNGTYNYEYTITDEYGCQYKTLRTVTVSGSCCTTATVPTGALSITQSTCTDPCAAPAGGVIAVGTKACAAGLVLQYNANGGAFSTTIPTYNQTTAVSVGTRCSCTSSGNFSATDAVATVPGSCPAQVAVALSVPVLTVAGCNTALPAAYASVAALTTATGSAAGSGTLTLTSTDATVAGCTTATTRTYTLTKVCGGVTTTDVKTQTINRITDVAAPVIAAAPAAVTVACGGTVPAAAVLSATDNCDATKNATMTQTSVTSASGCQTVITRKWNATDACANAATERIQTITVNNDADAPVIAAAPTDLVLACGDAIPAAATLNATDNCDATYPKLATMVQTGSATACDGGVITRKWNTTDLCTNAAVERVQTITVSPDAVAPVIDAAPAGVTLSCGDAIPAAAVLAATDNCDGTFPKNAVMTTDPYTATGCASYTITRRWNVSDCKSNAATERVQVITFAPDAVAPMIDPAPAAVTVACGGTVPTAAVLSATDNCDVNYPKPIIAVETSVTSASGCQTVITRKWNTTDLCTNAATERVQTITVNNDADAPVIAAAPADVILACGDAIPAAAVLNATDNCDISFPTAATMVQTGSATACDGGVITRKWNTTDACTNAAIERVQTITVSADAVAPVIDAAPANVSVCVLPAAAVLSATDNCDGTFPKNAIMTTDPFVVSACASYTVTRRWNVSDCKANAAVERVQVITVFPDPANFTVSATPGACSGTAIVVCGGATVATATATSTAPAAACPAATGAAATAPLSYVVNAGSACAATITGTATATGCPGADACILSVKWLYFDGTAYTGYNMLNWATANEVNNYFFDVQRSKNGVDFENIGRVNGSGTTNETKTYSYKDATPIAGMNIYRLRQIDFDGKFSTSNSVSLYNKMDKFKMLDAYPNPTKLDINVKLFAPTQGNAQIVVRDVAGKVVYTHNQMTTAGVNLLTIDASNFAEGMYMILAIDAKTGASSTIKFIKD